MKDKEIKSLVIFGLGGIGGYIGSRFAGLKDNPEYKDLEVYFLARGDHLEIIRRKGLTFINPAGEENVYHPTWAGDNLDSLSKLQLCFLCVKGYDLPGAVKLLEPKLTPETIIIPLLNGADIHERIRGLTNKGILLPGCIYIGANIVRPGVVNQTGGKGQIIIGLEPGKSDLSRKDILPLLTLLEDSGIPFRWENNPLPAIWEKYLFIASFALVTGMSGKTIGGVMENTGLKAKARFIMEEISALAEAKGIILPADAIDKVFSTALSFPFETKTSYQRDLELKKPRTEGDLFGGTILRLGKELGIDTPVTREVWTTILSFSSAGPI